jgi:hypothetical protein
MISDGRAGTPIPQIGGVPVGPAERVRQALAPKLEAAEQVMFQFKRLGVKHFQYNAMRLAGAPLVTHLMRSCVPEDMLESSGRFDGAQIKVYLDLTGRPDLMDDWDNLPQVFRDQILFGAHQPIKHGGVGFLSVERRLDHAYLGRMAQATRVLLQWSQRYPSFHRLRDIFQPALDGDADVCPFLAAGRRAFDRCKDTALFVNPAVPVPPPVVVEGNEGAGVQAAPEPGEAAGQDGGVMEHVVPPDPPDPPDPLAFSTFQDFLRDDPVRGMQGKLSRKFHEARKAEREIELREACVVANPGQVDGQSAEQFLVVLQRATTLRDYARRITALFHSVTAKEAAPPIAVLSRQKFLQLKNQTVEYLLACRAGVVLKEAQHAVGIECKVGNVVAKLENGAKAMDHFEVSCTRAAFNFRHDRTLDVLSEMLAAAGVEHRRELYPHQIPGLSPRLAAYGVNPGCRPGDLVIFMDGKLPRIFDFTIGSTRSQRGLDAGSYKGPLHHHQAVINGKLHKYAAFVAALGDNDQAVGTFIVLVANESGALGEGIMGLIGEAAGIVTSAIADEVMRKREAALFSNYWMCRLGQVIACETARRFRTCARADSLAAQVAGLGLQPGGAAAAAADGPQWHGAAYVDGQGVHIPVPL